jgi:hypothetical protein
MAATQQRDQPKDLEKQQREALKDLIGEQLLHTLGEPGNLVKVQVRRLWENYYRVNVYVGVDVVSAKVAHSYFLTADGEGNIIESTPKIIRRYGVGEGGATILEACNGA